MQPTAFPNVRTEECVFALENADVLLDMEEDTATKVRGILGDCDSKFYAEGILDFMLSVTWSCLLVPDIYQNSSRDFIQDM